MQAIPSALFFVIPVFSVFLIYVRLGDQSAGVSTRSFLSYLAVFSFVVLSIIAGSLGLAAWALERHGLHQPSLDTAQGVVIVLINFKLGLSVVYIIATAIPSTTVSHPKVILCNVALCLLVICATLLNLVSLFLVPSPIPLAVAPIVTLAMTLVPLPLLLTLLRSESTRLNSKSTRFWLTFGSAQTAAVLSAVFNILVVQINLPAFHIVESVFLVLWIVGMMSVFHLLPQRHPETIRTSLHPRTSKSPSPLYSHSHSSRSTPSTTDTSDFLHLRDPFASLSTQPQPQPQSLTVEKGYFSYFGPHASSMFKPKSRSTPKKPKTKRTAPSRMFIGSSAKPQPIEITTSPSLFPADYNLGDAMQPSLEDIDLNREEALLSQLLLRNLNYDPEFDAEKRSSAIVGLALMGNDLDYGKRDRRIIVTCERRGSESTVDSGSSCTPLTPVHPRFRFANDPSTSSLCTTVGTTTLYEPSSPLHDKTYWEPPGASESTGQHTWFQYDFPVAASGYRPGEKPLPILPESFRVNQGFSGGPSDQAVPHALSPI